MADRAVRQRISPFDGLKLACYEPLKGLERAPCPECRASRKYFCYECYVTVGVERSLIPHIKLPIRVDIIKHQRELAGKSTAPHACLLAPDDVHIFNYPSIPEFEDKDKVILLYPSEDAVSLSQLYQQHSQSLDESEVLFEQVVFIDSTWYQVNEILNDERLEGLRRVRIEGAKTHFWRPQHKPDGCLATIEAIYYFFKEYHTHVLRRNYEGEYDNLLYFFVFQFNLIQEMQAKRLRQYTRSLPVKTKNIQSTTQMIPAAGNV